MPKLSLQDFDFYEIHEAFAAQVLCTLKAWESAEYCRERLQPRCAAGRDRPREAQRQGQQHRRRPSVRRHRRAHPRVAAKLFDELPQAKRGLISVCTAGGMGVTAIVERAA